MIVYLLKTMGCLVLLMLAYHLLLEKEKMHRFNRFYLLFSIVASFAIPVITLPVQAELLPATETTTTLDYTVFNAPEFINNSIPQPQNFITSESGNWWPELLIYFYLAISLILLFRFVKNLLAIAATIRHNRTIAYYGATLVLTNSHLVPHSFLYYIFLHKTEYECNGIKEEILQHELTHVHQKHSLDILLMELLLVILWFNPVLYLYRKAIRLNHEFLADDAVVKAFPNPVNYQQMLLLSASQPGSLLPTSSFNYSITKKRLIMMTKSTSAKTVFAKQVAVLPFLAALVLIFSTKVIGQQNNGKPEVPQDTTITKGKIQTQKNAASINSFWSKFSVGSTEQGVTPDLLAEYENITKKYETEGKWWHTFSKRVSDGDRNRMETIFKQMNLDQQGKQFLVFMKPMGPLPRTVPTTEQLQLWKNSKIYGVWIDGKRIANILLNKYVNTDFAQVYVSKLTKVAVNYGKHFYQVNLMTSKYYQNYYDQTMANRKPHIGFAFNNHPVDSIRQKFRSRSTLPGPKIQIYSSVDNNAHLFETTAYDAGASPQMPNKYDFTLCQMTTVRMQKNGKLSETVDISKGNVEKCLKFII